MSSYTLLVLIQKNETFRQLKQQFSKLDYEKLIFIENDKDSPNSTIQRFHKFFSWKNIELALISFSFILFYLLLNLKGSQFASLAVTLFFILSHLFAYGLNRYLKYNDPLVKSYFPLIMNREMAILVTCQHQSFAKFIKIIQKSPYEPVAFFSFLDDEEVDIIRNKGMLPQTPANPTEFEKQTQGLAKTHFSVANQPHLAKVFLNRVGYLSKKYQSTYEKLSDFAIYNENIHLSAEWLLENAYTVQQSIKDIRKNLPEKFFAQLPFVIEGADQGIPLTYILVSRLVAISDGEITQKNILNFLKSYQSVKSLSIGELWAFPLVLKIRLIECLVNITKRILDRVRESQLADFWANRILHAVRQEPEKLYTLLATLSKEIPSPSPYFADQLLIQLGDMESAVNIIKGWFHRKIGEDLNEISRIEQIQQTLEQTSLAHIISSLRRLEQMEWKEIFEEVSLVEQILSTEELGLYSQMDFDTRDQYRHVIEKLAKTQKISENVVAKTAVNLTKGHSNFCYQHVGYYLIDEGKEILAEKLQIKKPLLKRLLSVFQKNRSLCYLGFCLLATLSFFEILINEIFPPLSTFSFWTLLILAFIPLTEIAIQFINFIIVHLLPPKILPKMSYEKGIPDSFKALVVTPTMLTCSESITRLLEKLEIQYLANIDPQIIFGLLTDFADHCEEFHQDDTTLLQTLIQGVEELNRKYDGHHFYHFHRLRKFNNTDKNWMGWERKRGKLEELNSYLKGDSANDLDELLKVGNPSFLTEVKYVITVDDDTQLPKNSVRRLVETLSHPLNQAQINEENKNLWRGYTIIQPRVSTNYLSANATWFSKLFSDPSGVDPYTKSSSDIYQDIFNEGVYHGKGIYDYQVFHQLLNKRLPDNQVLSHDLLEGSYVKTAFASDIELHDSFPATYVAYIKRQHRWVRGDWQLLAWLKNKLRNSQGIVEKNPLSFINRWKILDNLRRSSNPIAIVALLITSWFSNAYHEVSLFVMALIALPIIFQLIDSLKNAFHLHFSTMRQDFIKGVLCVIVNLIFLPHQALTNADAILRSLYRQVVSKKNLLQWTTSSTVCNKDRYNCFLELSLISLVSLAIGIGLYFIHPQSLLTAIPFLILWFSSPFVCKLLERDYTPSPAKQISTSDQLYLRLLARKTWRYFDDFTTQETNWLPPDNYQENVRIDIAYRTSPTNIGFYLMSLLSSLKFGFFTPHQLIDKTTDLLGTLKKLERYEGHFLNWYDIKNLNPLLPRYVSTVDTGNLLASFWNTEQAFKALVDQPIISSLSSVSDSLKLYSEANPNSKILNFKTLQKLIIKFDNTAFISEKLHTLTLIHNHIKKEQDSLKIQEPLIPEGLYWINKINDFIEQTIEWLKNTLGWTLLLETPEAKKIIHINSEGVSWKSLALKINPSLKEISSRNIPGLTPLIGWLQSLDPEKLDKETTIWIKSLINEVNKTFQFVDGLIYKINQVVEDLRILDNELKMPFLYNKERNLFSIGYNVTDKRIDSSCYDLLASEARLASFIAIARDEVPLEHWWSLGRPLAKGFGRIVLQSWGGTMFEYLMPVIWCKNFDNTLLNYACKTAVACQIDYGNQIGTPWGISESAYSRLDLHNIYQYRAFGVPILGIKYGLEEDFVITPYSSSLALMIDPEAAIKNLKRLDQEDLMNGLYGLYESIDFSREYKAEGSPGIVIHAYMAHHMGMSLSAYCNTLCDHYLQNLFHSHPKVKALESILYERPVLTGGKVSGRVKDRPFPKLSSVVATSETRQFDTAQTITPVTHLLSNGNYSVMLTNSGGGYSKYQTIDMTRWRADSTCDQWGSFFYIKDLDKNTKISTTYQPMREQASSYFVNFSNDKAEIKKKQQGLEIATEIVVSSEDNAEIRYMTVTNLAMRRRQLEITSYIELALAPHLADMAHQTFSKMFVETEIIEAHNGLLAFRRPRSPEDPELWSFHVLALNNGSTSKISYETDRNQFIGNNRTLANPKALDGNLTNSKGCVLDPIFSLRKPFTLEAGKSIKLSFVTGYASTREEALRLLIKYKYFEASSRLIELSWANSELDLRRLHITHEETNIFQRLGSYMIYPDAQMRGSPEQLRRSRGGQDKLWAHGISGDNAIILATIDNIYNADVIHNVLLAHAFWSLRGLNSDLILLNEEKVGYENPLHEQLVKIIQNYAQFTQNNKNANVFLLSAPQISQEDKNLIYNVASVVINSDRGSLAQQLANPRRIATPQPLLKIDPTTIEEPSAPLPFLELLFFNGIGGFTKDGREYAIYFENQFATTPAPWINVIANPQFGFLASESGVGMTWNMNSQLNRLTPWSNDPTVNPIVDSCYIRDDESGKYWTITPLPIRENDPYRIRHGHGYTVYEHNSHAIQQEMTVFTPIDDNHSSVKIQIIKLTNRSSQKRKLSLFNYVELVLGQDKEKSQKYINTAWNYESNSLLATNYYRSLFADNVVFASCFPKPITYTGSRKEFIGRNGVLSSPEALKNIKLSNNTDAGIDPCLALHTSVELYSGESTEIVILLGEGKDINKAKELSLFYQNIDNVHHALQKTQNYWNQLLTKIEVKTPDVSLNLIFNKWLTYQNLSCRMWARSAFYQSGGAYGFRDQLQDSASLVYFNPQLTRQHILKCASRQFLEGDVQHWWHPDDGSGVRTRISDDLLWLPYVTLHYVNVTGDESIFEELVTYLEGKQLEPDEHEAFVPIQISSQKGTIEEHCTKTLEKACVYGSHGLPLMGCGDWNDGMNLVGIQGKGESVWLGWFLIYILNEFSIYLRKHNKIEQAEKYATEAKKILHSIETNAWDGSWYLRAFFDDGSPIGSHANKEDKIDSLSQSWAIINGLKNERTASAMKAVDEYLVDKIHNLVLLFTPAFDKSPKNPGYIMGYPPGVRENGGQYTHAAVWVAMAFAKNGDGNKAMEVLKMINPITHTQTREKINHYRVEPYVTVADVYSLEQQIGRGGWSWYTGSASLMYRTILEDVLGFKLCGQYFTMDPCIPNEWNNFEFSYRHGGTTYQVFIDNPSHVSKGVIRVECNKLELVDKKIPLNALSQVQMIRITMG